MNYNTIITRLYFLLVYADGVINENEMTAAKQMIKAENLVEEEFRVQMQLLKDKDQSLIFDECVAELRKLDQKLQIRLVAWLCVVANADGFMDRNEWQMIYRIYHKELALPLHEVFKIQKELNRLVWEKKNSVATIL